MSNPKSWDEVAACRCKFCRLLWQLRCDLKSAGTGLFVFDCRMHEAGFVAGDIDRLFGPPATVGPWGGTLEDAVAFVLERQEFCYAMVSTFPDRPINSADFGWSKLHFLRAEFESKGKRCQRETVSRIGN